MTRRESRDQRRDTSSSRLRFKDRKRSRRSRTARSLSPSHSIHRDSGDTSGLKPDRLNPDDEAFYGSGSGFRHEPSLLNHSEDENFTERLFDALADDEGRDYWQRVYGQPIDDVPDEPGMTDDEYAAYVRREMWDRKHADEARARKIHEEEKWQDRARHNQFVKEQARTRTVAIDEVRKSQLQARWKAYTFAWDCLGRDIWRLSDVPWPTLQGTRESISKSEVDSFFSVAGDVRNISREELRRRWHPDRFQQRVVRHIAPEEVSDVLGTVTLVAQILNGIISE